MAFRWRADDGPTLNAGLVHVASWFFRGSGPELLRNAIFLRFFRRGSGSPVPPPRLWIRTWSSECKCNEIWDTCDKLIIKRLLFLKLLTLCLTMSSADNLCNRFVPRSGPTTCRSWSWSKLFDTLMVFLEKNDFEKIRRLQKRKVNYQVGKELHVNWFLFMKLMENKAEIISCNMMYVHLQCIFLYDKAVFTPTLSRILWILSSNLSVLNGKFKSLFFYFG